MSISIKGKKMREGRTDVMSVRDPLKFSSLSLKELQGLQAKVDKEINKRRSKIQEEGLKKIRLIAAEYGLSEAALKKLSVDESSTSVKATPKKRGPVAPKYRNPLNSDEMWTGRGRKPKWVELFLASGGKLEEITI
jgi:DNA-binding protein H-NS